MMALAIASGSPFIGATVLFAFVLGTSPVFFILGYFTAKLGDIFQKRFATVAAYAIILLAAWNINSSIALTGSNFTLQSLWNSVICTVSFCDTSPVFARSLKSDSIGLNNQPGPVSEATITIDSRGYTPSNLTVRKGSTVTLRLVNNGGGGCAQAFTIPKLNIQKVVPLGSDTIQFTAPPEPGELAFMCSMGMYRGTIRVI
ncbi:MAG: cupredoxin domain-containing protein [Candidatus Levybacteria bacterium]|nr:cupredoxin domain-containing protein [Candidatus Levybacteria bacterium]